MTDKEKKEQIEALKKDVARAEARGQYDTAHHDMLKRLLGKPEPKKEQENK